MQTISIDELVRVVGGSDQTPGSSSAEGQISIGRFGAKFKYSTGGEPDAYLRCMDKEANNCSMIQSSASCAAQRRKICEPMLKQPQPVSR